MQTDSTNPKLNFNYNGNAPQTNETLPVKTLGFAMSSTKASGQTQYLVYQTDKSSAENPTVDTNRALLVEYVFPLPVYGSMTILGAMKCTLAEVTII